MNVTALHPTQLADVRKSRIIEDVCNRIAPNWPLDQLIAVNPYWQLKGLPFTQAAARLQAIANIHSLMPPQHWLDLYQQGQIKDAALKQSAVIWQHHNSPAELIEQLRKAPDAPEPWLTLSALVDQGRSRFQFAWQDEIVQQISQFCAAYYQQQKWVETLSEPKQENQLYRHWLVNLRQDAGVSVLMGEPKLSGIIQALPDDLDRLLEQATSTLNLDDHSLDVYLHALLLDINGWAAYVAYLKWQSQADDMRALLAIRLAWELIIWRYLQAEQPASAERLATRWEFEKFSLARKLKKFTEHQRVLWLWHTAYELSEQQRLQSKLLTTKPVEIKEPQLQAVFCIDVRSEVMRRALEQQNDHVQTLGFAGFFGMPIAYTPDGTKVSRPQLPGLLQPAISASEQQVCAQRLNEQGRKAGWQQWSQSPVGAFSMVEAAGWWYGFKLLRQWLFPKKPENPLNKLSHNEQWQLSKGEQELTVAERAELAAGVLNAMGIGQYAPVVLLVGHASQSANNLHAAGLDCGACCGQSGEVNVRVLAALLNDHQVRLQLLKKGLDIPSNTRFVPALHNTTTDEIACFDKALTTKQQTWLTNAKHQAQKERAVNIDAALVFHDNPRRDKAFQQRAKDWSQVRPEWGLANNQAFIIGPRARTRQANLEGRCFLHDYTWQRDKDFAVLELLITAPMIVTHWINMQYNASVTDNRKFGSGNKVLHNAVGGNIGVFEGSGGDLRIGLAKQSLHNGERWMHQPQRLSVYICAPRQNIADIVERHEAVKQLVDNDWLYLFCWDNPNRIERYYQNKWTVTQGLSV